MKVKCTKCGYIGEDSEFPTGHDFLQTPYVAACPKCNNRQNPGDASMRMFGGPRPFEYVREPSPKDPLSKLMHNASDAS